MQLSRNVEQIQISGIRRFFNKVAAYPEAISLTVGQPDFQVPDRVKEAMIRALEQNKTGYTANVGIPELREAISQMLQEDQIHYSPDEICITVGGSEGIFNVFMAILNPGDRVLVPSIAYPAYESCTKLMGGAVVEYPLLDDFSIDFGALEALIEREQPKAIVVSYPSNPTGDVLDQEGLKRLSTLLENREIFIISDEMYRSILYQGDYYSLAQVAALRSRVILVGGFSKIFSMTGLRIGYVCASSEILAGIVKVHQYNVSCAPSIVQWGAYEGVLHCRDEAAAMRDEFQRRRDYVHRRLVAIGMQVKLPGGAFYMFPSVKSFGMTSEAFCEGLLQEAQVAMVPGSSFGTGGEGYIRLSYAYGMDQLAEGLNRLEGWIKGK